MLSLAYLLEQVDVDDAGLTEISRIVSSRRNFDMAIYKDKCMKRRVAIRMRACKLVRTDEYAALLGRSDKELELLLKALSIHVSSFYRNPSMFEKLRNEVLPDLFSAASAEWGKLKCWSLGSAEGEEAYTLSIILHAFFSAQLERTPVEICGFDIDAATVVAAEKGEYLEERLKELPDGFRERYFECYGALWRIAPQIRGMVTFHQRSISDLDKFGICHLVLCRNTLIYFNRSSQESVLSGIARVMPAGGILILGKSETLVGAAKAQFKSLCPAERIYVRL